MVQEVAKHIPDVTTFAANVVVFLMAVGAAVAGSFAMVKKIKQGWDETFPKSASGPTTGDVITQQRLVGTLMLETTTAAMMSESMRDLAEATDRQTDMMRDTRDCMKENTREMHELRHQVERLMDRLTRHGG